MTKASDNDFPSVLLSEQSSAPASPAAGKQRAYIRTSDHTLVTVDSSGVVAPVGGGSGSLTTAKTVLTTGDVTLTQNTYTDIVSVSLAAGTWLVFGQANLFATAAAQDVSARLYDSTNAATLSSGAMSLASIAYDETIQLVALVTLTGTATVKLQATGSGAGGSKALQAVQTNAAGNTATQINAVKVA